jgi:DNA polymerase III sliding clamp (beta) subunit (PCNA family)
MIDLRFEEKAQKLVDKALEGQRRDYDRLLERQQEVHLDSSSLWHASPFLTFPPIELYRFPS